MVFLRPFIILIYNFNEHNGAVEGRINVTSGYLTVETQVCALEKENELVVASSLCKELRIARYLLIPVLVPCAFMLAIVIWGYCKNREKADSREEGIGGVCYAQTSRIICTQLVS